MARFVPPVKLTSLSAAIPRRGRGRKKKRGGDGDGGEEVPGGGVRREPEVRGGEGEEERVFLEGQEVPWGGRGGGPGPVSRSDTLPIHPNSTLYTQDFSCALSF